MKKLINLHTNTEYSLLESTIKIDSLILCAKKMGIDTLSITDRNVLFGVPEFVKKCKKAGIKPIIGIDLDVQDFRFILLAKNYSGYKHISKLSTKKIRGEEIKISDINTNEIFIIDHPTKGYYSKRKEKPKLHNYFIGLNNGQMPGAVALNEIKIIKKEENKALSILHSIKHGKTKEFNERPFIHNNKDIPEVMIEQANAIAAECNVELPEIKCTLPAFETPKNNNSIEYLKELIDSGIEKKLSKITDKTKYYKRIEYEVSIIKKLGFADYFLIIQDMISWSKSQDILVGPGRGSAAGSLISYLLDITDVDPIKFGLLFERFLNPERVSMPDIDVDIQDDRRDEVIEYMFNKYGSDNTALIITFSRLGAKMALRDTARAMDIPPREVDVLSKSIKIGETLDSTYEKVSVFRANINKEERLKELLASASLIEGLIRNLGTHAAGIVISKKPISDSIPTLKSHNDYNQTQYSMDFMEQNGLLKIDILGLRNLSVIKCITDEILSNYKKKLLLEKISINDDVTNEVLKEVDTNGIFQLESYGMKKTLAKVKIDSFNDLSVAISLFRPGPMEFIDVYANRKFGKELVPKISPEYDEITKDTFGIIVYQEQIMQISQKFAGMSFAKADILRRAISKKKIDLIRGLREEFIKGAIEKKQNKETINRVYKSIEAFAQYGFNKSHAVSYAIIAYRMAFLKARFPVEFYTATLNSYIDSQNVLKTYVNELKSKDIKILSPNINLSKSSVYNEGKKIIMPLILIKGLGIVAQKKILEEREENGVYKDFYSLIARLKVIGIGETTLHSLISSNALRKLGNMQTLYDSFPSAIRYAKMITNVRDGKKTIDFSILRKPKLIIAKRNISSEIIAEEKLLGMNYNAFFTDAFSTGQTLKDLKNNDAVIVAIYVENIFKRKDKNGNEFASIICNDSTGKIDATMFANTWEFVSKSKSRAVYIAEIKKQIFNNRISYIINKPWKEQHE